MQTNETSGMPADEAAPSRAPSSKPGAMWAIVELFGHARIAGAVSEQAFGGAALVRVDVPQISFDEEVYIDGLRQNTAHTIPAHTRSFGAASIYSMNWCDEATALLAAHGIRHQPLRPYNLRTALAGMPEGERQRVLALTAGNTTALGDDDDHGPF